MAKMVKVTKTTLGNICKELNTKIARGSQDRQLTNDEIKSRCDGLMAYCQLSKEQGGYASATARAQMMANVREEVDKIANAEMTQRNNDLAVIATDQEEDFGKLAEMVKKMQNKNNNAIGIISNQSRALEEHSKIQSSMAAFAEANLGSIQAEAENRLPARR